MENPIVLVSLGKLHALARKFGEVLIASLATLLVTALWSNLTKPAAPVAQADGGGPFVEERLAADNSKERLDDFMERIALSHVAALKAAPPTRTTRRWSRRPSRRAPRARLSPRARPPPNCMPGRARIKRRLPAPTRRLSPATQRFAGGAGAASGD